LIYFHYVFELFWPRSISPHYLKVETLKLNQVLRTWKTGLFWITVEKRVCFGSPPFRSPCIQLRRASKPNRPYSASI